MSRGKIYKIFRPHSPRFEHPSRRKGCGWTKLSSSDEVADHINSAAHSKLLLLEDTTTPWFWTRLRAQSLCAPQKPHGCKPQVGCLLEERLQLRSVKPQIPFKIPKLTPKPNKPSCLGHDLPRRQHPTAHRMRGASGQQARPERREHGTTSEYYLQSRISTHIYTFLVRFLDFCWRLLYRPWAIHVHCEGRKTDHRRQRGRSRNTSHRGRLLVQGLRHCEC